MSRVLFAPHVWLIAAACLIGLSFVAGYVEEIDTADRVLALRQGAPEAVAIQDFDAAMNVGPAREVMVRAEADFDATLIVKLGEDYPNMKAVILPLYALSDAGAAAVQARLDPSATGLTAQVERRSIAPDPQIEALGILMHIVPDSSHDIDPMSLVADTFGAGRNGTAIELNGETIDPGELALIVKGALSVTSKTLADGFLTVAPYEEGRVAALTPPPSNGLPQILFWAGILLGLGTVAMSFHPFEGAFSTRRARGAQTAQPAGPSERPQNSRFQPLPTQDEIYAAEDAVAREPSPAQRVVGSVVSDVKERVTRVKSRR